VGELISIASATQSMVSQPYWPTPIPGIRARLVTHCNIFSVSRTHTHKGHILLWQGSGCQHMNLESQGHNSV
jgi:hypothetical protein